MIPSTQSRRILSWVLLAAAVVVVVVSAIQTFTADPHQGEGWIGGPIQAVFVGGPLLAVGIGLRSSRRVVARRTAVASLLLALGVGFVLVMQLLDPHEILADRLVQVAGLALYLAAFVVELPALSSTEAGVERDEAGRPVG